MASLGTELSTSCEVARCLASQLFDEAALLAGTPARTSAELERALYLFAGDDLPLTDRFRLRSLLEAIVMSPTFLE
jgi:hypothetical protein